MNGILAPMTENEARALMRAYDSIGGLEGWIAGEVWQAVPEGWTVPETLQGWSFRLVQVSEGLCLVALAPTGGGLAVWIVKGAAPNEVVPIGRTV